MTIALSRRNLAASAMMLTVSAWSGRLWAASERPALARVIIDNDFAGDPDGLFQLAHHLLSPSVQIPFVVGSHLPAVFGGAHSASDAVAKARELLTVMKQDSRTPLYAGAEASLPSRQNWKPSPATAAIVREALRTDTTVPLVYAAGASLTELALAWLVEPRIGKRIKLIWIGGSEYQGVANPPPGPPEAEFNFGIDPLAAQVIFNESDIEIWQVPRDAYRQMLFSAAELDDLAASSSLGRYLKGQLEDMAAKLAHIPGFAAMPVTETYILGDSPLVTLSALLSPVQADPSSSRYIRQPTPYLKADGTYQARPEGRPMRLYTQIDAGLTIRDMESKFRAFGR